MMTYLLRWSVYLIGILTFSLGVAIAVNMQYLGIHPWDVLNVALYDIFGFSVGTWMIIISLVLIGISWLLDKSYIQFGTFLNAVLVGIFVDMYRWLNFLPQAAHDWADIVIIICGIVIMGLGGGIYNAGGVGSGPRDGFMLSIADKTGASIGKVRIITETGILLIGLVLGGPVFVFTFIFTFIQSPIFAFTYTRLSRVVERIASQARKRYRSDANHTG